MPHFLANRFFLVLILSATLVACDSGSGPEGEVLISDIIVGGGPAVSIGQTLTVSYVGMFVDGTVFDSSEEAGKNFNFTLGVGQVLKGWDQGLVDMKVGGVRRLEIPSHLAFGKNGQTLATGEVVVPGNTDVIYEVTMVSIFDEVISNDIIPGDGETAEAGDVLAVDYIGQFNDRDGHIFDASSIVGGNFVFTLGAGSVIPGWEIGLAGMKVGGIRELTIPPQFAYGPFGSGNEIPPYTILFFRIELIDIVKRPTG